ncbi:MAG: endonuclease III [Firmicutes bacterium]|nr:endonuclease III [Bacillota bacterium]
MERIKAVNIIDMLAEHYGEAGCSLKAEDPFQLLVAVILSAQCTDRRVNEVTERLFQSYRTPTDFAALSEAELVPHIFSCGFYHNKARSIIAAAKTVRTDYDGAVPDTMEELLRLPGVGRKTANVMISAAFGGEAIAVDTHVFRVTNRIGLASSGKPEGVEMQLRQLLPVHYYTRAHYVLIRHGRGLCRAGRPICAECPVLPDCKYGIEKRNAM